MTLLEDWWKNLEFISVGTNEIVTELMRPPIAHVNYDSTKPSGGIWTTEDTGYLDSNFWLEYIRKRDIFARYFYDYGDVNCDAVSIKLKKEAKILSVASYNDFLELKHAYPIVSDSQNSNNRLIDYHKLSKDYDGLLLSENLFYDRQHSSIFIDWSVESLVIFNTNCIEYIRPFEIARHYSEDRYYPKFKRANERGKRSINPINEKYCYLLNELNDIIKPKVNYKELIKIDIFNYWEFVKRAYYLIYDQFSKNPNIIKAIVDVLNKEVLERKIKKEDLEIPLILQIYDKNYDYIDDTYKKLLKMEVKK